MKRFYETVTVESAADEAGAQGWTIALDGRRVMTPDRAPLFLRSAPLAAAIAEEWRTQGERIDPASMAMTGFANAAIDKVAPARAGFIATIAAYGESDLLCYRAEGPKPLVDRQAEAWDPLLDWAARRYDVAFVQVAGIIHKAQPEPTLHRLAEAVAALSDAELAALSKLVSLTGSLVIVLALIEGAFDAGQLWAASCLDEIWQAEQWGEDDFALKNRRDREADFQEAVRFLTLAQGREAA